MNAPDRTPYTVWICTHVGEYGRYFSEAVEAEGEYGGQAVQYTRAPPAEALAVPEVRAMVEAAETLLNRCTDEDLVAQALMRNLRTKIAALRAIGERADG